MKKIVIFGNSASGKSTLAKWLSGSEGLSHLDLDGIAWMDSVPPKRKPLAESQEKIQAFMQANDAWVIEGCYADLLALVLPYANEMIFLNLPVNDCIDNAKARPWEPHKYPSKTAQDENLMMLLAWIAEYEKRDDVFSLRAHKNLYDNFSGKKIMHTARPSLAVKHVQ